MSELHVRCEHCYDSVPQTSSRRKRFCSERCRAAWKRAQAPKPVRMCARQDCSSTFRPYKHQQYCSEECKPAKTWRPFVLTRGDARWLLERARLLAKVGDVGRASTASPAALREALVSAGEVGKAMVGVLAVLERGGAA